MITYLIELENSCELNSKRRENLVEGVNAHCMVMSLKKAKQRRNAPFTRSFQMQGISFAGRSHRL
jgi:hypothetical protein